MLKRFKTSRDPKISKNSPFLTKKGQIWLKQQGTSTYLAGMGSCFNRSNRRSKPFKSLVSLLAMIYLITLSSDRFSDRKKRFRFLFRLKKTKIQSMVSGLKRVNPMNPLPEPPREGGGEREREKQDVSWVSLNSCWMRCWLWTATKTI